MMNSKNSMQNDCATYVRVGLMQISTSSSSSSQCSVRITTTSNLFSVRHSALARHKTNFTVLISKARKLSSSMYSPSLSPPLLAQRSTLSSSSSRRLTMEAFLTLRPLLRVSVGSPPVRLRSASSDKRIWGWYGEGGRDATLTS